MGKGRGLAWSGALRGMGCWRGGERGGEGVRRAGRGLKSETYSVAIYWGYQLPGVLVVVVRIKDEAAERGGGRTQKDLGAHCATRILRDEGKELMS